MIRYVIFILFFLLIEVVQGQEFENISIKSAIKTVQRDDFVTFRSIIVNNQDYFIDELNYNFVVLKLSGGNVSKSNQSNDFSLKPNEEKILSEINLNLKSKDEVKAYLFIKQKGKLIHRDTLFLLKKKSVKQEVDEEEYILKGIVVDEAITRIGKDYHDLFFKEYLVSGKKYPFIIKIIEKPALGRTSVIHLEAEGKKIHEFFVRPDEEYLKTNVVLAMRKLRTFNSNRKSAFSKKI